MVLTNRVLDFARPPQIERRPVSAVDIVRYALTLAGKQLEHGRIDVDLDLPENLPPVLASRDELAQVFLNLIINASEAMSKGGRLSISARLAGNAVELTFADSGPGLAPEVLETLFQPFHTTKDEGTGLGLALSYSIVQQHGGTIVAGNAPSGGALFVITLPLALDHGLSGSQAGLAPAGELVPGAADGVQEGSK
jgi:signal transduction histidine kinase